MTRDTTFRHLTQHNTVLEMNCKLGFSQSDDGELLVILELLGLDLGHAGLSVTRFGDEGSFLTSMVLAELEAEATTSIISNILLVIGGRPEAADWTECEVSESQLRMMGLSLPVRRAAKGLVPRSPLPTGEDLRDVLMQAPMPLAMLVGPQHEFAFINAAYVRLIGRRCAESVLGLPVRDALPELGGQGFFRLLNEVYRTGTPHVGREASAFLRSEEHGNTEQFYFDFIYYPARDRQGKTYGVLCLATDVTEQVVARQVSEGRELQLYKQWAELEAIYKGAPVGMALVDAREYRLLRINDANASLLAKHSQNLLGRRIFDLFPKFDALREIYQRVSSGEEIKNLQLVVANRGRGLPDRRLLVTFSPVLDACGLVEAIASTTIDCGEVLQLQSEIVLHLDSSTWTTQIEVAVPQ